MYRFSIVSMTVLATLLILGGCAAKTAGDAALSTPETADEAMIDPAAATPAGIDREASAAPSSATLNTLNGTQLEPVYFDYDAFSLSETACRTIERNANWLQGNPTVKVTIEGHCDERGSDEYNLALGERRALAVKNYLTTLGVNAERLAAVSFGEEQPAVAGQNETAWAKNRRSEFK